VKTTCDFESGLCRWSITNADPRFVYLLLLFYDFKLSSSLIGWRTDITNLYEGKIIQWSCDAPSWWPRGLINVRASCARGLKVKSQAGQFLHSVVSGSLPFSRLLSNYVDLVLWRGDGHRKVVTRFGVIRRV